MQTIMKQKIHRVHTNTRVNKVEKTRNSSHFFHFFVLIAHLGIVPNINIIFREQSDF